MCGSQCPWISKCLTSEYSAFKSALSAGKKIVFTGVPVVLGERKVNDTFYCESANITDDGLDEIVVYINIPCTAKQNAADAWKFVS